MRVFVLTGAGISAESGLGTFRDKGGIWARFDPMKLATPEAFAHDPDQVHAFYNARRENLLSAEPNAAHRALARLEAALVEHGGERLLVAEGRVGAHTAHGEELTAVALSTLGFTAAVRGGAAVAVEHVFDDPTIVARLTEDLGVSS